MAADGQGAPLVPMLDFCMFRHATKNRLLLNLGGIANVTALPAGCDVDAVMAFDTGPANMVVDALMVRLFGKKLDRSGAVAGRGRVLDEVVEKLLDGRILLFPATEVLRTRRVWRSVCRPTSEAVQGCGKGRCRGDGDGADLGVDHCGIL